jgi:GxxExxY protein
VIGAAIVVHRHLGPGLLESAYRQCLFWELSARDIPCRMEVPVGVTYRGRSLEAAYRIDLLVDERLIVELKSVDRINPVHQSQVITYLKVTGLSTGLIINFNVKVLKDGLRRVLL